MPDSPLTPLQYLPTMQGNSPLAGNNLAMIIKALAQQKNSSSGGLTASSLLQPPEQDSLQPNKNNIYGGFNYGGNLFNQYDPNSTGTDLAQAAQAGVQSGLTFDPSTGSVY